jgi:lysyl-tRNA synthetase class 2
MLEWYRIGFDHHRLMRELDELLRAVLDTELADTRYISFSDAFQNAAGLDPHNASDDEIQNALADHDIAVPGHTDRDGLLDLLLATAVTATFETAQPTFVYDYPVSQAALARVSRSNPPVAERFELFLGGVELANGFNELCDADEQMCRFDRDLETRRKRMQATPARDDALLDALASGLPDCAGVALGIDRLLMVATGASDIASVVSFDITRA